MRNLRRTLAVSTIALALTMAPGTAFGINKIRAPQLRFKMPELEVNATGTSCIFTGRALVYREGEKERRVDISLLLSQLEINGNKILQVSCDGKKTIILGSKDITIMTSPEFPLIIALPEELREGVITVSNDRIEIVGKNLEGNECRFTVDGSKIDGLPKK